jgi:demethylmenaquinone methyltransferase / 2-methoxy-6-polyprenyl-1,4-benzoquinol methylase
VNPAADAPQLPERGTTRAESVDAIDEHGRRVQAMFSDIAPGYDRANRLMSLGTDVRWRRRAVATVLPADAGERPRILDLCAGTLDSSFEIHRAHPHADVVGGDFSTGMLAAGRRRLAREGASAAERITPKHMDAHEIPEPHASFDAAFVAFGVRNLSDQPRAAREMARVLRPGGKLTVLEFFRPTAATTRVFHGIYNRTVLPLVGWACTGNLDAYLYLPRSMGGFLSVDEYVALLRASGFSRVEHQTLTFGVASIVRAYRDDDALSAAAAREEGSA